MKHDPTNAPIFFFTYEKQNYSTITDAINLHPYTSITAMLFQ